MEFSCASPEDIEMLRLRKVVSMTESYATDVAVEDIEIRAVKKCLTVIEQVQLREDDIVRVAGIADYRMLSSQDHALLHGIMNFVAGLLRAKHLAMLAEMLAITHDLPWPTDSTDLT